MAWAGCLAGLAVWMLLWLLCGGEGGRWPAQARLSLGFPYQSHDLARPRQGFLLDFLGSTLADFDRIQLNPKGPPLQIPTNSIKIIRVHPYNS